VGLTAVIAAAGLMLAGCAGPTEPSSTIRDRAARALTPAPLEIDVAEPVLSPEPDVARTEDAAAVPSGAEHRTRGVALGGGGQDARNAGDVLDRMRNATDVEKGLSKALVEAAQGHLDRGELEEAEVKLEQALGNWAANQDAIELLDEVRMRRGDRRGELPYMARILRDHEAVQRKLLRYEIERHLNRAEVAYEGGEYAKSIDSFKRAADGIRNAPYEADFDKYLARAEQGLARSEKARVLKEERERLDLQRLIQESKSQEEKESFDFVRNHIRALRRRAMAAMEERDYDRATELYAKIIELDPHDEDALRNRAYAKEKHHLDTLDRKIRESVENFQKAVIAVEESSIVYQQIFRYPDKYEWLRLSPKVVSIEEQAEKEESAVTKNLRLRLSQPVSFGVEEETPLRECLNDLQRLSGINFFIQDDGGDLGTTGIVLEQLNELPLQNVLTFMLRKLDDDDVGFVIRDGAVVIAQGEENLRPPEYLRFYEVSDITNKHPDFPAPELALDSFAGQEDEEADIDIGGEDDDTDPVLGSDELK